MEQKDLCGNGEIILVLDDEPEILNIVENILKALNYSSVCLNNFTDGIDYFTKNNNSISLILMDYLMHDSANSISAEHTISKFREIDPIIKIMVMSGNIIDGNSYPNLDVNKVISKPFTIEQLAESIKKVLNS